jgi:hypothetical protein
MRAPKPLQLLGRRLSAAVRRASRYRGMLVIVLWQAPVGPYPGPNGSVSMLFGGGLDQYVTDFGCDGPTETASQRYRLAALEFDRNITETVRLDAVAGGIGWEPRDRAAWSVGEKSSGAFGHVHLRWDWKKWGVGGGVLVLPDMNHDIDAGFSGQSAGYTAMPSGYLRVGSAERLHGRLDLAPPNASGSQVPARGGIAWNATRRDRPAWFVGFAVLGSSPELLGEGFAGEATLPVSGRASVRILTHYGRSYDKAMGGIALGGRFTLGAPRATDPSAVRSGDGQ